MLTPGVMASESVGSRGAGQLLPAADGAHSSMSRCAEEVIALQAAGRFAEALAVADSALPNCPPSERAALLAAKSVVLTATGDMRDALSVATAAREAARESGSQPAMADAGLSLALALQTLDEHRHAIDIASECDQIGRDCGDESLRLRAQRLLANSYSALGLHRQAITILEQVLARLAVTDPDPHSVQMNYARMNLLRAESRRLEDTTEGGSERQRAFRDVYARWHAFAEDMRMRKQIRLQAIALAHACRAASEAGDPAFALASLETSLPLQYSVGLRRSCADAECQYGIVLFRLGRLSEARAALSRALSIMEAGGPRPLSRAWEVLSEVEEALGSPAAALQALKQARHFERQLRDGEARVAATLVEQRALIDRLSDEWSRLASEDALTGVANRRAFDRHLQAAVDAANADERAGAQFALAFLDLDRFKSVNDQCGHGTGDVVLQRFSAILLSGRRGNDLVARIGGDEFAILFGGLSAAHVGSVVQKLVDAVRHENWVSIHPNLQLTVSAGVAVSSEVPRDDRTATALLRVADNRLYAAKRAGRDRAVFAD
jgi:diguanylate cyclase (GGDEF)-like protein